MSMKEHESDVDEIDDLSAIYHEGNGDVNDFLLDNFRISSTFNPLDVA